MAVDPSLSCFKAYDIRGRVPDELNGELANRIGRAYVELTGARRVCVGHDMRLSGPEIVSGLVEGLLDAGADVLDIGLCGTEEIYFTTAHFGLDGGIAVTASHNPADYNGMKLVRESSRPISADTGLTQMRELVRENRFQNAAKAGTRSTLDHRDAYVAHLLQSVDRSALQPLKLVCNPGNGAAGAVVDRLSAELPFEIVKVQWLADGTFPNGVPNPMLPECRDVTRQAVLDSGADLGLAWDGDFDRCFFFDANGRFIEGYYLVGLLAGCLLEKYPGGAVVHDPRLTWSTLAAVQGRGGRAVVTKSGHAFIKDVMRSEDAVYGGEMSAHHYFRDFFYCDSGMLPWLLICELMSRKQATLAELVDASMAAFPCSGEINFEVADPPGVVESLVSRFSDAARVDRIDGLSVEFDDWRFNVRASNTEPLLRLNVETRGDAALLEARTRELRDAIRASAT